MMENRHILVLCAYKESKYLEDCIVSLKNQTLEAPIIISTSTPNEHILGLAESKKKAYRLVANMLEEIYEKTGDFKVRGYFS